MKKVIFFLPFYFCCHFINSQNLKTKRIWFFNYGIHRDVYSRSTLHFIDKKTDNFDFKIHKVKAKDQIDIEYLFSQPTVPQYVMNLGFYFKNKPNFGIEFSIDHLKYVMVDFQNAFVSGQIRGKIYEKDTLITPDFVKFEHSNGNNYLMVNAVNKIQLSKDQLIRFNLVSKLGGGVLAPKSNTRVLGKLRDGPFFVSGMVFGASSALNIAVGKHFFTELAFKGAYAIYTNGLIAKEGKVKHQFLSGQAIINLGLNF